VLLPVIKELKLPFTADQLAANVKASVPKDTVLIDVSASDESARRSRMIAASVARHFATFVSELESSRSEPSPVKVTVTSPAQLPGTPTSPRKLAYLMIGLTMGLVLGAIAAVLSEVIGTSRLSRERLAPVEASEPVAPAEGSAFAPRIARQGVSGGAGRPVE
jgi:capsular polysaccharide biosynthesis protein